MSDRTTWTTQLCLTSLYQVFVMKGTNEIFTDYEKYLKRYVSIQSLSI